jgi:hypothetical protein
MRRVLASILCLATVLIVCSGAALACVCGGESRRSSRAEIKAAIAKEFNESAMVFSGEVIAQDTFEVKFKITTIWKGDEFQEITISTGAEKISEDYYRVSSCDYRFRIGEKYLVYALITADGKLVARYCTRTNTLAGGKSDIPQLNKLNPSAYPRRNRYNDTVFRAQFWFFAARSLLRLGEQMTDWDRIIVAKSHDF